MNIRELKEIIKDLPDDMEIKIHEGGWDKYFPLWDTEVVEDDEGKFFGIK